uniref:Secreted protein n=1 Tax=Mesocestoides corti TaxID=53468 RepID=A0A5K3G4J1_MESCO
MSGAFHPSPPRWLLVLIRVCLWLAAYLPCMPLEHRESQDWLRPGGPTYLRPESEARATRQAPSIRVHHAGHAAHCMLHLSRVLLWLA